MAQVTALSDRRDQGTASTALATPGPNRPVPIAEASALATTAPASITSPSASRTPRARPPSVRIAATSAP